MTYREAYAELETILTELQEQPADVDALAAKVARAETLLRWCRDRLQGVENQLENFLGGDE